jgi:hypothetical protein
MSSNDGDDTRDPGDDSQVDDGEWETATRGYSPDKLYTRSTDMHGHSETLKIRMPTWMMAKAREVADKRGVGAHDIVRNYVFHQLMVDEKRSPGDPVFKIPAIILLEQEAMRSRDERTREKNAVETACREIQEAIEDDDLDRGEYLLSQAMAISEEELSDKLHQTMAVRLAKLAGELAGRRYMDEKQRERQQQRG